MKGVRGAYNSSYMHWAKTQSESKFNLATSGLPNLSIRDLNVSLDELELTYGGYGYPPLLRALATRYGVESSSIVTTAGTSFANHLSMAALFEPGEEILFEEPAYEPMLATARYLGADVRRFERKFEDDFRVNVEEIESLVSERTRLIVITNLHNPTGVFTDEATLKQVGQIARQVGSRVLVNEVYLEAMFEDAPQTSFHLGDHFVVTSSLTKAFGLSGLRSGWIIANPDLASQMWLLNDLFSATQVHTAERLSIIALRQIDEIAARAKALLDRNRVLLNAFLDTREDLECVRPQFGTTMFPRLRSGETSTRLCQLLRQKYDTTVVPGRFFERPAHIRVGIAGDTDTLTAGLERLGSALDEIKSNRG